MNKRTALLAALAAAFLCAFPLGAQTPPGTDIHLFPLDLDADTPLGTPVAVTRRPGYDNQPAFLPDGRLVYTVIEVGEDDQIQADIWIYDLESRRTRSLTDTEESEYSPTPIPGERAISVIQVEANGIQRLWRFPLDGSDPNLLLPDIAPVGYHAWADKADLLLFVLGEPPTLQRAKRGPGAGEVLARDIGRSLHRVPGSKKISFLHKEGPRWTIKTVDPAGKIEEVATARPEREDYAWAPDGSLWMGDGTVLYRRLTGGEWQRVADLGEHGLGVITRLAIHPDGAHLALVAAETSKSDRQRDADAEGDSRP